MSPKSTAPKNPKTGVSSDKLMALSLSQLDAYNYLNKKRIFEFFQFLICHLLAEQPDDPVAFLGDLLDRCMMFRSGLTGPPLLFTEEHVQAMYRAMDRLGDGYITIQQYQNGLTTMNIMDYNTRPTVTEEGLVAKTFFINEALDCMTRSLADMLRASDLEESTVWNIPAISPVGSATARSADGPPQPGSPGSRSVSEQPPTEVGSLRPALCNVPGFVPQSPPKKAVVPPPDTDNKEDASFEVELGMLDLQPPKPDPQITDFADLKKCELDPALALKSKSRESVTSGNSTTRFVRDLIHRAI